MDNIINRWRSVSKLYRLSLQRTAVGESAEENVYIEWASEGDRKGFDWVWKTERGLSVKKGRHMLVCKSGRLRASSGVAPQILKICPGNQYLMIAGIFYFGVFMLYFSVSWRWAPQKSHYVIFLDTGTVPLWDCSHRPKITCLVGTVPWRDSPQPT